MFRGRAQAVPPPFLPRRPGSGTPLGHPGRGPRGRDPARRDCNVCITIPARWLPWPARRRHF